MSAERIRLFLTPEHPCSYLEDRDATTAFVDPALSMTTNLYTRLSQHGFRRSGSHVYRPQCTGCRACVPVRVPVAQFRWTRRFRRTLRRNADLDARIEPARRTDEIYDLYASYIRSRHGDGDMSPPSPDQFDAFLRADWSPTSFVTFRSRADDRLQLVAVVDELVDGLSAIYTFFDPAAAPRSPGTLAVLWQIDQARRASLPHVYLGYWIHGARKMQYKTDFRPCEVFDGQEWRPYEDVASAPRGERDAGAGPSRTD